MTDPCCVLVTAHSALTLNFMSCNLSTGMLNRSWTNRRRPCQRLPLWNQLLYLDSGLEACPPIESIVIDVLWVIDMVTKGNKTLKFSRIWLLHTLPQLPPKYMPRSCPPPLIDHLPTSFNHCNRYFTRKPNHSFKIWNGSCYSSAEDTLKAFHHIQIKSQPSK